MEIIDNINSLYKFVEDRFEIVQKKQIIFIINAQERIGNVTIEFELANKVERFTPIEYSEIISAINELEINYRIYLNELEFIEAVVNKKLWPHDIIVFNFARNGLKEGKKSLIPSFCGLLNIKCTGSNAFVQSLCRNKYVYNKFLDNLGIKGPKTFGLSPNYNWIGEVEPSDLKNIILKPIAESGSIGVNDKILNFKELNYNEINFVNGQSMLFQEFIDGKEVECPFFVYNENIIDLLPVELEINDGVYLSSDISANNDYNFKVYDGVGADKLSGIVKRVVSALNINGYGRLDFRITNEGEIYLFDVATMPFICEHSSFSFAMKHYNFKRSDIFKIILGITELQNK